MPSPGSGATCLTHCDGSDTEAEVSLIMSSVKSFSNSTGCGRSALLLLALLLSEVTAACVAGSGEGIVWASDKGNSSCSAAACKLKITSLIMILGVFLAVV